MEEERGREGEERREKKRGKEEGRGIHQSQSRPGAASKGQSLTARSARGRALARRGDGAGGRRENGGFSGIAERARRRRAGGRGGG